MKICPLCEKKTDQQHCPGDKYLTISAEAWARRRKADRMVGTTFQRKYKIIQRIGKDTGDIKKARIEFILEGVLEELRFNDIFGCQFLGRELLAENRQ